MLYKLLIIIILLFSSFRFPFFFSFMPHWVNRLGLFYLYVRISRCYFGFLFSANFYLLAGFVGVCSYVMLSLCIYRITFTKYELRISDFLQAERQQVVYNVHHSLNSHPFNRTMHTEYSKQTVRGALEANVAQL